MVNISLRRRDGVPLDAFEMMSGTTLWVFIRKRGHPIGSACSGVGVCGACAVKLDASAGAVSEQTEFERETLRRNNHPLEQRLACLCRVWGPLTVTADYW